MICKLDQLYTCRRKFVPRIVYAFPSLDTQQKEIVWGYVAGNIFLRTTVNISWQEFDPGGIRMNTRQVA